ncbi:lipopolysaccharide biosynthesis protein [Clostridium perfringens]|uniref:lipopolysaccharide biosynthesis protein n=1 Tax=Clostridium perfringens TaxID=1502 RepID=UPI001C886954|nr:hypothetical protein [Clostridium perfringens]
MFEKYKIKLKNIVKKKFLLNYIYVFLGQNIISILNMFILSIMIKIIGLNKNGEFILIQSYIFLISDLFNMQTFNGVIKFMSRNNRFNDNGIGYAKAGYLLDLITGISAFAIAVLFLKYYMNFMNISSNIFLISKIYLLIIIFRNVSLGSATGVLRYYDKYNKIVNINLLFSIIKLILLIIVYYNNNHQLIIIIFIELIIEICTQFALIYVSFKEIKIQENKSIFKYKYSITKEFLGFNLYNCIVTTIDLLLGNVTNILIGKYLGDSSVSILRILEKIGGLFSKFTIPFNQIIYPKMCESVQKSKNKTINLFEKYIKLTTPIGIFILLILYFSYNYWMVFFTKDFYEYKFITMFYLFYTLFTAITALIHPLLVAYNLVKYNIKTILILNIVYIILLPFLMSYLGLFGVVFARLLQSIGNVISKYKIILKYGLDNNRR